VDRCDVAVLLVDATEPMAAQDTHVAGFVQEKRKGLVIAVNKWDLIPKDSHTMAQYERMLREHFKFLPFVPVLFISATEGQRIERVIAAALKIREERQRRIPTALLNDALRRALADHQVPSSGGKLLKIFYVTQVGIDPPTFVFKVNDPSLVHFGYERFLENRLRETFGFVGTPIRIYFRPRSRAEAS
jgi:GTP-binding protein